MPTTVVFSSAGFTRVLRLTRPGESETQKSDVQGSNPWEWEIGCVNAISGNLISMVLSDPVETLLNVTNFPLTQVTRRRDSGGPCSGFAAGGQGGRDADSVEIPSTSSFASPQGEEAVKSVGRSEATTSRAKERKSRSGPSTGSETNIDSRRSG